MRGGIFVFFVKGFIRRDVTFCNAFFICLCDSVQTNDKWETKRSKSHLVVMQHQYSYFASGRVIPSVNDFE